LVCVVENTCGQLHTTKNINCKPAIIANGMSRLKSLKFINLRPIWAPWRKQIPGYV